MELVRDWILYVESIRFTMLPNVHASLDLAIRHVYCLAPIFVFLFLNKN